jgi:apolipoprotein N-acyltransferase
MSLVPGFSIFLERGGATASPRSRRRRKTRPADVPTQRGPRRSDAPAPTRLVYATAIASGLAFSAAWLWTETITSAGLGWMAAALLVYSVRACRAYKPAYCCGLVIYLVSFYWIYGTIERFGGYGAFVSGSIFAAYVASGAVFFLVFAWTYHNLPQALDALALRAPLAIVVAEMATIRLFYWHFGHTQIAFTLFAQIAGIGGVILVSFVMFWVAEACVRVIVFREWRRAFLLPAGALAISLGYGAVMMQVLAAPAGQKQEVVLVQGPPSLAEKRDMDSLWMNLARIHELSKQLTRKGALIVWPEGAVPAYVSADLGSVHKEASLPWLGDGSAFLVGGFGFDSEKKRYNTAFAVYPDGTVPFPYFKQLLIPFGEYMPFASVFPWLNSLNENAGLFSWGKEIKVFPYPMERPNGFQYTARIAPLICYEDTVTGPASDATRRGAELLVNLTYDTWFGRTAASYQHHLIATFRAIENRRYLIRSTYTGYTAVVNPLGKTIASIPPFAEGMLTVEVPLLHYQSSFTNYVGELPWWGVLALAAGCIGRERLKTRKAKRPALS